MQTEVVKPEVSDKKQRLIAATVQLIIAGGYSATTVDQICAAAGVTKGSFFHYFASKEVIAKAAMEAWAAGWHQIVDDARLEEIEDPLDRVHKLFETMAHAYIYSPVGAGCMIGTVAQEQARVSDPMREIFLNHFQDWVSRTSGLLEDAKKTHPPKVDFDSEELAWWMQSFVQGTLLIAKTRNDRQFIENNIRHCRAYVDSLFGLI